MLAACMPVSGGLQRNALRLVVESALESIRHGIPISKRYRKQDGDAELASVVRTAGTHRSAVANEMRHPLRRWLKLLASASFAYLLTGCSGAAIQVPDSRFMTIDVQAGELYVGSANNGVSVIDTATRQVVATIPLGPIHSYEAAIDPVSRRLFVPHGNGNSVSIVDTAKRAVIGAIPVASPQDLAVDTVSGRLYVSGDNGALTVFDLTTRAVVASGTVDRPISDLAIDPLAHRLFILTHQENYLGKGGTRIRGNWISVMNTETYEATTLEPNSLYSDTISMAMHPSDQALYLLMEEDHSSDGVSVVHTDTLDYSHLGSVNYRGSASYFTLGENAIYVADAKADTVTIGLGSHRRDVSVENPKVLAVDEAKGLLFVSHGGGNDTISVISTH